ASVRIEDRAAAEIAEVRHGAASVSRRTCTISLVARLSRASSGGHVAATPQEILRVRSLADQAIAAALDSDWPRSAELNKQILDASPDDVEARNRFGRALLELGRLEEARAAYQETLKAYPHDPIGLRQVARVNALLEDKHKPDTTRSKTQTRLFIEDL